jgi:hypothetical protein
MRQAHKIALELTGWIIPFVGLVVLHLCDNPPCCRPSHLRIGTPDENNTDMFAKGRQARGERVASAKLRQVDVDEIRRLYAAGGISKRALARQFRVHHSTIMAIITGETWAHVPATEAA